jgi:hypothetical protein
MAAINGFTHRLNGESIPPPRAAEKPGPLCILACRWCYMRAFWIWAGVSSHEAAKQEILSTCEVGSRKDLDTDVHAAARFNTQIRKPFMEYLESVEVAQ